MKKLLITILLLISPTIVFAEKIEIYCPKCKVHLYDYVGSTKVGNEINADDIITINDKAVKPENGELFENFKCPFDDTFLNGWYYYAKKQHFKSFTMAYSALSFLTKNDKGEWCWLPYDIPINMNEEK